jgi:hypothetical protein
MDLRKGEVEMKPRNLEEIINKKRYRTENSILLASDAY